MARKWSNLNLPGALHFVTGNFLDRATVFTEPACCNAFLEELHAIDQKWPSKLIAYVLMPDHFHLIGNPRDGRIKEFVGRLKSLPVRAGIVKSAKDYRWSSFRSFYSQGDYTLAVDQDLVVVR
jgi:REP element-mobilizing transposase RayT